MNEREEQYTEHFEWGVIHPDYGHVLTTLNGRLMTEEQARDMCRNPIWKLARRTVGPFEEVIDEQRD